jgi:phosphoribosylformylglycinamidine synthase subunit PurQ / glutaminase
MSSVAVVVFPGSNCDRDAHHAIGSVLKADVTYHWHTDPLKSDYRAVILPGGFSYGDYLRAGALAKISPAVESLHAYVDAGKPVLGICNGFQILVEAGFLPGALSKNESLHFQSEEVVVRVASNRSPFLKDIPKGKTLRMPIAHSEGRYVADAATLAELEKNDQIALTYESNVNGSMKRIAGLTNVKGNVLGLMPHPERCAEEILGNADGLAMLKSLLANA